MASIGWRLIRRYRRQVMQDDGSTGVWTIEDLERMRDTGQITDQEFKILRDHTMQGFMAGRKRNKPGKSTSPGKPNDRIGG